MKCEVAAGKSALSVGKGPDYFLQGVSFKTGVGIGKHDDVCARDFDGLIHGVDFSGPFGHIGRQGQGSHLQPENSDEGQRSLEMAEKPLLRTLVEARLRGRVAPSGEALLRSR